MISRILHLLVIDILAVGVALRRNPESAHLLDTDAEADERLDEAGNAATAASKPDAKKQARSAAPGVSLASPLACLTSHSR